MKVLVTSSTGLTGRAVVKALADKGVYVRAMVHSESKSPDMISVGASETVVASIEKESDIIRAMEGVDAVFYICPTAHPEEGAIGCMAVDVAEKLGISRFVYQSVHNSIEPELPHHRQKLMVEQHLLESKLNYTILRPAAFMQNILGNSRMVTEQYVFAQRFFTSMESDNRINLINVNDYAEIASTVISGEGFDFGCFDLCGPKNLSAKDMIDAMEEVLKHEVTLRYIADEEFIEISRRRNAPDNTINTLLAMFRAYNNYGFKGNSFISEKLLGRKPVTFKDFLHRNLL